MRNKSKKSLRNYFTKGPEDFGTKYVVKLILHDHLITPYNEATIGSEAVVFWFAKIAT